MSGFSLRFVVSTYERGRGDRRWSRRRDVSRETERKTVHGAHTEVSVMMPPTGQAASGSGHPIGGGVRITLVLCERLIELPRVRAISGGHKEISKE